MAVPGAMLKFTEAGNPRLPSGPATTVRSTVRTAGPAFSTTRYFGAEKVSCDCGGMSSSLIVTATVMGPTGVIPGPGVSVTLNDSAPSLRPSLMIGITTVFGAVSVEIQL